jgi:hypothetical protein
VPTSHEDFETVLAELDAGADRVDVALARTRLAFGQGRTLLAGASREELASGSGIALVEAKKTALRLHGGFQRTMAELDNLIDLLEPEAKP